MKAKLKELEMQLNYVCYEKEMITKLNKVWAAYFELKEEFDKLNSDCAINNEVAVCTCENSIWNRDTGCFVCDECNKRI